MLTTVRNFLGEKVDNSPLVLFRIFYGLLLTGESIGAILTGWVNETFIEPKFTFTIIGFEWMQPLAGDGMIYYFILMGILGILISLGLFYRVATFGFLVMWTVAYMMQKSHYNNHYYLLILLAAVMFVLPAHRSRSLDVRLGFARPEDACERICHWFFILQIMIVYVYASFHKINPDWINGSPLNIWFKYKTDYWLIGPLLGKEWMPYLIAWGGILFDGTIVFLLLHPKSRKIGFVLSLVFNLFNSAVFQIGIFPYLMILLCVFFFPPEQIRSIFFRRKPKVVPVKNSLSIPWTALVAIYFLVQLLLPLRHYAYAGPVSWTDEGHKLSWRMMLRRKSGSVNFTLVDQSTGTRSKVQLRNYLTPNQLSSFKGHPDMIWQLAQRIGAEKQAEGKEVAVFVNASISLNGHPHRALIDPKVDLTSVPWEPWKHSDWILIYEDR
ncbi:MAG: HTTM domain-containing protein [Bacteroidota bacterium]